MPPKKTTEVKAPAQQAAATPAPAAATAPKAAAAPKAPKAPAAPKAATPAPAATTPAAAPAQTTSTTTESKSEGQTAASFSTVEELEAFMAKESASYYEQINGIVGQLNALKNQHKATEKSVLRALKALQKQSSKRKRKAGNRSPSGFVKPARITEELAKFLSKPVGTEMARTEVTREINNYIKTHNLKDSTNGRKINPDAKLAGLLKLKKEDELTYFNLQKFLSCHFTKAAPATA